MSKKKIDLINPFVIDVSPMERLLLVNFEKDPDALYIGFEPQVFNDSLHGKGHLVIAWRQDGKVDIYHEPGLRLAKESYDIVGKGLENLMEREFVSALYEVEDSGVQANYQFEDISGRRICITISEKNQKKRKPFGLLAPMGDAAENPSALPLILLHDFYFVRKKDTDIRISIDGKIHQPDSLPMPMDGANMFFTRYSPRPLIATLNPAMDIEIPMLQVSTGQKTVSSKYYEIALQWNNNQPEIMKLTRKNDIHPITIDFPNAFPNIQDLPESGFWEGAFTITGDPATGSIKGHYQIEKEDDATKITVIPSGGWRPKPAKLSLRFLYTVAKIFKNWPKTYQWTAKISKKKNMEFQMISSWKRI